MFAVILNIVAITLSLFALYETYKTEKKLKERLNNLINNKGE